MSFKKINAAKQFKGLPRIFTGPNAPPEEEQRKAFEEGKQAFREGRIKNNSVEAIWVKKKVSKKEWEEHYKHIGTYCMMGLESDGVWIGFCTIGELPHDCWILTDEEARRVDLFRRANNIAPYPIT